MNPARSKKDLTDLKKCLNKQLMTKSGSSPGLNFIPMKKLLLLLLLLSAKGFAFQSDTTIIEYNDNVFHKKIKVKSDRSVNVVYPRIMNINHVLKAFDVDSTERDRVWVLLEKSRNSRDTLAVVSRSGDRLTVTTRSLAAAVEPGPDEIVSFEDNNRRDFDVQISNDGTGPSKSYYRGRFFSRTDFAIYLGLNSYTGQADVSPDNLSELRVWPSRYLALSFRGNATLANSRNVHLVLSYGPEFAWHNFMLMNGHVLQYENGQALFTESSKPTEKSKFVVPHINLPVLLNIGLKKEGFRLGIGGYVGYRIGGYTKVVYKDDNNKEKYKESLGLNDLKYGLTAEIGHRHGAALFIRYDLSDLFRSSQVNAKDMQAFSFGVRL